MDKLKERAKSFERLMDIQYRIVLGRKGVITELIVDFSPSEFQHLIGLHKLTDVFQRRYSSEKLYKKCLYERLTYDELLKSSNFSSVKNRFEYFLYLENILDSNKTVFKCNNRYLKSFSKIESDFMMKTEFDEKLFYVFLERRMLYDNFYCKSFINDDEVDYAYSQTSMTLLRKEKIHKRTGKTDILFDRKNV